MSPHEQLDQQLADLEQMLPIWLEKLRHPSQFWPQFDALAQAIFDNAPPDAVAYVRQRLDAMLAAQALQRPSTPCFPDVK